MLINSQSANGDVNNRKKGSFFHFTANVERLERPSDRRAFNRLGNSPMHSTTPRRNPRRVERFRSACAIKIEADDDDEAPLVAATPAVATISAIVADKNEPPIAAQATKNFVPATPIVCGAESMASSSTENTSGPAATSSASKNSHWRRDLMLSISPIIPQQTPHVGRSNICVSGAPLFRLQMLHLRGRRQPQRRSRSTATHTTTRARRRC